ncbi:MAG: Ppx/GppA family phosphatase [Proteobacteria bacterium]|nr:Ppx/GppA family phosphatase [Pseudomonadota bacterium]
MSLATIDIGTNSVLLLVAEVSADGELHVLEQQCRITRLGQGVDRERRLLPAAIERTLAALSSYRDRLVHWGTGRRAAVGTSALRDAANGPDFLERATTLLGCPVEVVSGLREAELVVRGVAPSAAPLAPGTIVFDVGGGSTELITVGQRGALLQPISLDLGSVRLSERHLAHDPPLAAELEALRQDVRQHLAARVGPQVKPLASPLAQPPRSLIGVAGTLTTLAAVELGLPSYDGGRVDGARLTQLQIQRLGRRLAALPLVERCQLPGLPAQRADVIVAGALLVDEIMQQLGASELEVSDRGVRWGLARELAASGEHGATVTDAPSRR